MCLLGLLLFLQTRVHCRKCVSSTRFHTHNAEELARKVKVFVVRPQEKLEQLGLPPRDKHYRLTALTPSVPVLDS